MNLESTPGPFAEPTGDISGIDADALMSGIDEGQTPERPMVSEPVARPQVTPEPQATTPTPTAQEISFTWNGKEIKAPLDKAKQWAQQGYDYSQRMQAFKTQMTEFEQKQKLIQELESRYKPVEEFYSQNPDRWEYVNKQYEAMKSGLDPNNPLAQELQTVKSKLSQYDQFIQSAQQEKLLQKQTQEDTALDQEIQSIQGSYKDLDWKTVDAEGKNLELRVLEHASKIGTSSFRAALRDLYHDQLVQKAEERAKENVIKDRQKQTKLGLLGQSSAPTKGITDAHDIRNKTMDELIAEGAAEFGISYR
jgi:hypothetical protein